MAKENNPYSQAQGAPPSNDPAAVLLDVLRKVSKEVTLPALERDAEAAVEYHTLVARQLAPNSLKLILKRFGPELAFDDLFVSDAPATQQKPGTTAV